MLRHAICRCVPRLASSNLPRPGQHASFAPRTGKYVISPPSALAFVQIRTASSQISDDPQASTSQQSEAAESADEANRLESVTVRERQVLDDVLEALREEPGELSTSLSEDSDRAVGDRQRTRPSFRQIEVRTKRDASTDRSITIDSSDPVSYTQGTVIITGASGAIGRAIGVRFARMGHSIVLCGRNKTELDVSLEKVNAASLKFSVPKGQSKPEYWHEVVKGDVCDPDFYELLNKTAHKARLELAKARTDFQPPDAVKYLRLMPTVLVNCAGISQTSMLMSPGIGKSIESILDTNLLSAIKCSRDFIGSVFKWRNQYKKLESRIPLPASCIINVSSLLATHGGAGATVYAASKAGMTGFSRALSIEMAQRQIRVNTILPGYIESEMTAGFSQQFRDGMNKHIPAGRFGTPEEVGSAAYFLAKNEYLNSCEIRVDGGLSAGTGWQV